MTDYLTEQEQIELIKGWLKQYGLVIVLGIALALGLTSSWQYWQTRQNKIKAHASGVFDEMMSARAQMNASTTQIQAEKLLRHYRNTVYGPFAALMLARQAVVQKNYLEAKKQLMWALQHATISSIKQIARLRLARLYLELKQPQSALTLLAIINDQTFNGLINEIKGDAYLMENKIEQARIAYKLALSQLPNAQATRPLLQMKLDNLATTN